jgi:hypothetical protein
MSASYKEKRGGSVELLAWGAIWKTCGKNNIITTRQENSQYSFLVPFFKGSWRIVFY